jgi:hypothetical protein
MAKSSIVCAWCEKSSLKERGSINRSISQGMPLYCDRECAGLGRRTHKTKAQRLADKAEYDRDYREKHFTALKAKRAAYFQRTYDPAVAAVDRKKRMNRHVDYCRRPEYRVKKKAYDTQRRASEFGEFADCYVLLSSLENEIADRATRYEIYSANGTLNKRLQRRRAYEQSISG